MEPSSAHFQPVKNAEKEKFSVDQAELSLENGGPLPEGYGDNRLVILPRDPLWFFAYWEITEGRIEQIRQEHGRDIWKTSALVLRVYDISGFQQDGLAAAPFFDIEIPPESRQWYVNVPQAGHTYRVEIGLRLSDGRFIALLRSNSVALPAGCVSDQTDSQWMAVGGLSERQDWENFLKTLPA